MTDRPVILVVDDDPLVCRTLERALVHLGYLARPATEVSGAFAVLAGGRVDAVLLDVRLPGARGDALALAILRQYPALRGRLVLMSGHIDLDLDGWPDELRAAPFLAKPFPIDQLAITLAEVLVPRPQERRGNGH